MEYVAACSVCARNKMSRLPAPGLLQPLPVPKRHLLGFRYGSSPSEGNTTVLTVVDRFSKVVHFILLLKLLSAKETAEVMLSQVFRLHGLPGHVVSNRVCVQVLEGVLLSPRCYGENLFWLPSPV